MNISGTGAAFLAAGLLCLGACSSSAPSVPAETAVSEPVATAAARISGAWQLAVERGGRSVEGWLHFSAGAGEIVGTLTGENGDPRELSKITLKGGKISWQVESEIAVERYEGTVTGSSMKGTIKMSRKGRGDRSGGGSGGAGGPRGGGGGRAGRGGGRGGGGDGSREVAWTAFRSAEPQESPKS